VERFTRLEAQGAHLQRPLWASTGTKNPAYRDVRYVEELIGPDSVTTIPRETVTAFEDHGRVERTIDRGVAEAHLNLDRLQEVGIDLGAVTEKLLSEGIEQFSDALRALDQAIDRKSGTLRTATGAARA
jgi:transaldolase